VLPAGALRAHGVDAHVGLVDLDLDAVIDHREHRDAGERGVPPRIGIERRDRTSRCTPFSVFSQP
jgi:hypothetical protein